MISKETYSGIYNHVLERLAGLSPDLYYHSIDHTLDVLDKAQFLADKEGGFSAKEVQLLKIASLYHDTGFLVTYQDHEEAGCGFVRKDLPLFSINEEDISIICGLIRTTKIPQTPLTRLEEIISDADLDYLGRDDFFPISQYLFHELKARNMVKDEDHWNNIQVRFFTSHRYFTPTSIRLRKDKKVQHLKEIQHLLIRADQI